MKEITVHLQSPSRYERIDGVTSFVGNDASGSFGILPGHERMITVLSPGIARMELGRSKVEYLGLPVSVLYLVEDQLFINADKYLKDSSYKTLSAVLRAKLQEEEELRLEMRETIRRMEETLLKQLIRAPGERLL
jgi:F-type H+-transporting ATPase subunit epsilon